MALLTSAARALLVIATVTAGCYAPELRDCAVRCRAADDCGPGQVCGADGMCAAPDIAGRCGATPDARPAVDDASAPPGPATDAATDAATGAPPDAPRAPFALTIKLSGRGRVLVAQDDIALGQCDHTAVNATCAFEVVAGAELRLTAMGLFGHEFDKWTSLACAGQDATCTLTVVVMTTAVAVKFADD